MASNASLGGIKFPSYNIMEPLGCGGVRPMTCKTLSVWVVLAMYVFNSGSYKLRE